MAKAAEKLIILGDLSAGLQCRLYFVNQFKRPPIFEGKDFEKIFKKLHEKFPSIPDDFTKMKEYEAFRKRAGEFVSVLADFYNTFVDLVNVSEEAWKLLTELAGLMQEFKFEVNPDLQSYYMQLLVRYVSVHLLCDLVDQPLFYIATYAKAYHITTGNTEPNVARIHNYFTKYKQGVWKKLQDDCVVLNQVVGPTLASIIPILMKYSMSAKQIIEMKLFNVADEPHRMTKPPLHEKPFTELCSLDKLRTWLIYGYLICPHELQLPGALDALKLTLRDSFTVPIFRDKTFDAVKQYDILFDNYKDGKFKLSKHTKYLKEAVDWEFTVSYHAELRTYLRLEMNTLLHFFTEQPQCIAPKISVLYALLHTARDEVLWYFRHLGAKPFKPSKTYQALVDPLVSELIHFCVQFLYLIKKYRSSIQQYYLQYIQLDLEKLEPAATEFLKAAHTNASIPSLIQLINENLRGRAVDDNFEAIRLNWYRLSAAVNSTGSGIGAHIALQLTNVMNVVTAHTRNIDMIDSQLKMHASFMQLFWYRNELFDILKESVKSPIGQPRHCMAFLRVMHDALHNVHRICPEEQPMIGKDAITLADTFLRNMILFLDRCLFNIKNEQELLRKQTSSGAIIRRLSQQLAAYEGQQSPATATQPLPGAESLHINRQQVANLRVMKKLVAELSSTFQNIETITVYNLQFAPKEYLIETIQSFLRNSIRQAIFPSSSASHTFNDHPVMNYPSRMLKMIKESIFTLSHIDRAVNVNMDDLIRDVLMCELNEDPSNADILINDTAQAGSPSNGAAPPSPDRKQLPIIHNICTFYYHLFAADLTDSSITYSPLRRCFVRANSHSHSHSHSSSSSSSSPTHSFDVERYTDVNELQALLALIGPSGFASLDKVLLRVVTRSVKAIKENLVQNQALLQSVFGKFSEFNTWLETVEKLQGVDSLVSNTVVLGSVLHFRQLLKDALFHVTKEHVPFLHNYAVTAVSHTLSRLPIDHTISLPSSPATPPTPTSATSSSSSSSSPSPSNSSSNGGAGGGGGVSGLETVAYQLGVGSSSYHSTAALLSASSVSSPSSLVGTNCEVDVQLRSCLARFKTQNSDGAAFYLLPEIFSLVYVSQRWKHASYSIEVEGHLNNVHCTALAIRSVIVGLARVPVKSDVAYGEPEKRISLDLERWFKCSAYSILHLSTLNKRLNKGDQVTVAGHNVTLPEYPVSNIAVFLEQLILECKGRLTLTMLEDCYPFTMLRTNFIQMYDRSSFSFAPVADDGENTAF